MHLIGRRYQTLLEPGLDAMGLEVLWLPDNPDVDSRLAGHADLSIFAAGRTVVAAGGIYSYLVQTCQFKGYSVLPASMGQKSRYPADAGLCICDTGRYIIANPAVMDPALVPFLHGRMIQVAQGYSRCAVVAADDHSIISADPGICRAARTAGMDVLQIAPGFVQLDGFPYGFLGGAVIRLTDNTVAFTGKLDDHPDKNRIVDFLHDHGQTVRFLTDKPVFDVGGGIFLP